MKFSALKSAAVVAFATVLAVGVSALPGQAAQSGKIVIALEAPLTGSQSNNGRDQLRGAQLAAMQINAKGGVLGKKIKIVGVDDKADPKLAKTAVKKAAKAGAIAVVGPYNSSVGIVNLPLYYKAKIFPARMTSSNETEGLGVTTQPMNSQIAPAEIAFISATGVKSVAMLVDTSDYTLSIADQTSDGLLKKGIEVIKIPITAGSTDFSAQISKALATNPGMIYSSTYYPEGSLIAQQLLASAASTPCFMGLANVDPAFVTEAGLAAAQHCTFSGVPAAPALPSAKAYVKAYVKEYKKQPGVWGAFTYDAVNVLAAAIKKSGGTEFRELNRAAFRTKNFKGATGTITYQKNMGTKLNSGTRTEVPVEILVVNDKGSYVIAK